MNENDEIKKMIEWIFYNTKKESSKNFAGSLDDQIRQGRFLSQSQISTLKIIYEKEFKANDELPLLDATQMSVEPIGACGFCFGNGVYLCTKNDEPETLWAFRCHCGRGCNDRRAHIPQYKPAHKSIGFVWVKPPPMEDILPGGRLFDSPVARAYHRHKALEGETKPESFIEIMGM